MSRSENARRIKILGLAAIGATLHTVVQSWTILSTGFGSIREAYAHDQFGYLSMVVNASEGRVNDLEPVTETGSNSYPRAYYTAVGTIARILDIHPVQAWNGTSLTLQFLMVGFLGVTLALISRRSWVALLAPVPFLVGNFSWFFYPGEWAIPLQSHAVLWGPFLALFSLNAEVAGLCISAISITALALVWMRPARPGVRWVVSGISAAAIGALANFQTYSFLASIYVIAAVLAAIELHRRRSRLLVVATVAATILVFAAGPLVSDATGQLPTLIFGLLPFVPGLVALAIRSRARLVAVGVVAVLFAVPQVAITVAGVGEGDPFLTFRTASNVDLGILFWRTIAATGVAIVAFAGLIIYGHWRRSSLLFGIGAGSAFAMTLVAVNDVWGANAEPYRLWINTYFLSLILIALSFAHILRRVPRRSQHRSGPQSRPLTVNRRAAAAVMIPTLLVAAATAPDFVAYATDERLAHVWNPATERERAQAVLAENAKGIEDALIAADPCVDPRTVKVNSGARIAYYHLGMAWPQEYEAIATIVQARLSGGFDFPAAERSGTVWILTDTACVHDWGSDYADRLVLEDSIDYEIEPDDNAGSLTDTAGTISLYRIIDQG